MKRQLFLLIIEGDVEPTLQGPYASEGARIAAAQQHRRGQGDNDGLYRLDTFDAMVYPEVRVFSGLEVDGPELPEAHHA